jgi:hypothetical protein
MTATFRSLPEQGRHLLGTCFAHACDTHRTMVFFMDI